MPYIKVPIDVKKPTPLYLFLMKSFSLKIGEAQRMIDRARVYKNGEPLLKKNSYVSGVIEVVIYKPSSKGLNPIFDEEDFAIFDKPSGLLVHPTSRNTNYSLTDEVVHLFGAKAHIVHRLDKETSGLILVSKNKRAEAQLKRSFEDRSVEKSYLALVRGEITKYIEIDAPLLNNPVYTTIKQRMIIDPRGKPSKTKVFPVRFFSKYNMTLVKVYPITGRQHQIRVHLFHVKHPILGDPIYGVPLKISERYLDKTLSKDERLWWMGADRLLLHAHTLTFKYKGKTFFYRSGVGALFMNAMSRSEV